MYQNLPSNISKSRPHTSSIFMSFSIKSGTQNSKMEWKPEPEVVFGAITVKNQISGFLGLVSRWYVYVWRRRDRPIDRSTGDTLDCRRGPETELLCSGEPTPITLSVSIISQLRPVKFQSPTVTLRRKNCWPQNTGNRLVSTQNVEIMHNCGSDFPVRIIFLSLSFSSHASVYSNPGVSTLLPLLYL